MSKSTSLAFEDLLKSKSEVNRYHKIVPDTLVLEKGCELKFFIVDNKQAVNNLVIVNNFSSKALFRDICSCSNSHFINNLFYLRIRPK